MSNQIDYRAEVLKVIPSAVSKWSHYHMQYVIGHMPEAHVELIGFGDTRKQAWESAYETLKQQGKI